MPADDCPINAMSHLPLPEPCYGFYTAPMYSADQMYAYSDAVSAALRADNIALQNNVVIPLRGRIKVLEDALREALDFQSAPNQPTIHDWGRWRRVLEAAVGKDTTKELDCRTCDYYGKERIECYQPNCKEGDFHTTNIPPIQLWRLK